MGQQGVLALATLSSPSISRSAGVGEELEIVQRSFFYSISLSHFMMKNDRKMNGMSLFHCLLLSQVAGMAEEIRKWFFAAFINFLFRSLPIPVTFSRFNQ